MLIQIAGIQFIFVRFHWEKVALRVPDIRRCRYLYAVDILFVKSSLPSADDVWPGNADQTYKYTDRQSANEYHDDEPMILGVLSKK